MPASVPAAAASAAVAPLIVPVVVVAFDAPAGVLEAGVGALLATDPGDGVVVDVVVVDNGGRARDRLTAAGLAVGRVVDLPGNRGFGAACNAGFAAVLGVGAPAVVVLNDDVVVRPGWLGPLVAAVSQPGVGAVQPLLVRPDGVGLDSAGVGIDRFGAGSDLRRGEPVDAVAADAGPADSALVPVPAVTGGAAVFAAAFLAEVGGFDERFFLYYEDVELCLRGRRAGWSFGLVPTSRVEHVGSATTMSLGDRRLVLQERNRLWCTAMHGTGAGLARAVWLSVRRLRHRPYGAHRAALVAGLGGAVVRRWQRWRGRPPGPVLRPASTRAWARVAQPPVRTAAAHPVVAFDPVVAPDLSVVIVTYGTGEVLDRCLASLHAAVTHDGIATEVVVVDHPHPERGRSTADHLCAATSGIVLVRPDDNLGFGGGNNLGVAVARSRWVCLLNPDAFVEPGHLARLLAVARDDPGAIVAPAFLNVDGTVQEIGRRMTSEGWSVAIMTPGEAEPDYGSAACWVFDRSVFESLGGFDPAYHPAYYEDVDLAMRARRAGRAIRVVDDVRVVHVCGGATTNPDVERQRAVFLGRWADVLADRTP